MLLLPNLSYPKVSVSHVVAVIDWHSHNVDMFGNDCQFDLFAFNIIYIWFVVYLVTGWEHQLHSIKYIPSIY